MIDRNKAGGAFIAATIYTALMLAIFLSLVRAVNM